MEDSSYPFTRKELIAFLISPAFVGLLAVFCIWQFPTQEEIDKMKAQQVAAQKEKDRLREAALQFGPIPVSYEGPS
jgi:hypothetical protein